MHGWSEPEWTLFPPPIGRRLVHQVYEMADLDVLTDLCGAGTVSFKAGTEFPVVNRAMGLFATLRARSGRPRTTQRWTPLVQGSGTERSARASVLGGWRDVARLPTYPLHRPLAQFDGGEFLQGRTLPATGDDNGVVTPWDPTAVTCQLTGLSPVARPSVSHSISQIRSTASRLTGPKT